MKLVKRERDSINELERMFHDIEVVAIWLGQGSCLYSYKVPSLHYSYTYIHEYSWTLMEM